MSVPQQLHGQSTGAFQSQFQDASALKGGSVSTKSVKFNIRDITRHRVSNYLLALDPRQTQALAMDTCKASKDLQRDQWNKSNLEKDLKKHDLPRDFSHRGGFKKDKLSAVLNLFKGVQEEAIKAEEGDDLSKAEKLKNFLQDPASVFVGGRSLFIQKMAEYEAEVQGSPQAGNGSPATGSHNEKEPGLSPAENPAFEGNQKPPLPSDASMNISSAPPDYDAVQADDNMATRLMNLSRHIANLQQGQAQDFQSQPFQEEMKFVEMEIIKLGSNSMPRNLHSRYSDVKAKFEGLQKQQQMILVNEYSDQIDSLQNLIENKETNKANRRDVEAIERKLEALAERVGLLRPVDRDKKALLKRVDEVKDHIRQWKTCTTALDTIESMTVELGEFDYKKTRENVELYSGKLDKLNKTVESLPPDSEKNELLKQVSQLQDKFESIQAAVKKQYSASVLPNVREAFDNAEALVSTLERDPNPPGDRHLTEANTCLSEARDQLTKLVGRQFETDRDGLQTTFSQLAQRLNKLKDRAVGTGQPTTAKIQPENGNQSQPDVEKIRTALDTAEAPIEALTSNPASSIKDDLRTQARSSIEKATQMLGTLTDKASKPERAELNTRLTNLNEKLNNLERRVSQGSTTQGRYVSSEQHQAGVLEKFGQTVSNFEGKVGEDAVRDVCANLSTVFAKLGKPSSESASQRSAPAMVFTNPPGVSFPGRQANTSNIPLTSLASGLGLQTATLFTNEFVKADLRVDLSGNSGKLEPVMISKNARFNQLPGQLQTRMLQALGEGAQKRMSDEIAFVQLFLVADDPQSFKDASMKMAFGSELTDYNMQIFEKSHGRGNKYNPLGVDLWLPEDLKKEAGFFKSSWALNENLIKTDAVNFSFARDERGHRQDIGLFQLQELLRAAGATETMASSDGVAIPFIVEARRQSKEVINQLLHPHAPGVSDGSGGLVSRGLQRDGAFHLESAVETDGQRGYEADVTDGPTDSGVIPMALNIKTTTSNSEGLSAGQVCETKAGILCVRTLAGIDANDCDSLRQRIGEKTINSRDLDKITIL